MDIAAKDITARLDEIPRPFWIAFMILGFVFYELPNITPAPAAADPIHVTVEGHQYYWQ